MGWIIVLALFIILSIALIAPLKIHLNINDSVSVKLSYLFLGIFSYDSAAETENKEITTDETVPTKKESKKDNKFVSLLKDYAKTKNKKDIIIELFELLKLTLIKLKLLICRTEFKNLSFSLTVATSDAADTAILYGRICAVLSPVVSLLEGAKNFSVDDVRVQTDFTSEDIKLLCSVKINVRVIYILAFAFSIAFTVLKMKLGEMKNGRK